MSRKKSRKEDDRERKKWKTQKGHQTRRTRGGKKQKRR
jgi:hypothetical protein